MNKYVINVSKVEYLQEIDCHPPEEKIYVKNMRYERAIPEFPNFSHILVQMRKNIVLTKRFQYVDVKLDWFSERQTTTPKNFWHLDSAIVPGKYFENQLYVVGFPTVFCHDIMTVREHVTAQYFNAEVSGKIINTTPIKEKTIVKYWGDNLHRGSVATEDGRRLLIRMINTDEILPQWC